MKWTPPPKMSTSNPWNQGFYGVRSLLNGISELFGYYLGFGKNSIKSSAKFHMPLGKEQLLFFLPGPGIWKQLPSFHVSSRNAFRWECPSPGPYSSPLPSWDSYTSSLAGFPGPMLAPPSLFVKVDALTRPTFWVTQLPMSSHQSPRAESSKFKITEPVTEDF